MRKWDEFSLCPERANSKQEILARASRPGSLSAVCRRSENKLQRQLQNARVMRSSGPEEATARQARRITGREVWSAVAACGVGKGGDGAIVCSRACVAPNISKLSVIENVEGLRAEFKAHALLDGEVFEKRHVEVRLARVVQEISAGITKGQPTGCNKHRRVEQQRPEAISRTRGASRVGIPDYVWARTRRGDAVTHACIIARDAAGTPIIHTEWRSGLNK